MALTGSTGGTARIELLLQPPFPAGDHNSNAGFRSISRRREPDIVLTRMDPEHPPKWSIFDAKYRTQRTHVLEAMASAHIYRDALRWRETDSEEIRSLLCEDFDEVSESSAKVTI